MTARNLSSWVPNLLGPVDFQVSGADASVPRRSIINLVGISVADDADNERTNVSVTAGASDGVSGSFQTSDGAGGFVGITFGTGVAAMLGTFSSANIASACSDETGTGALVFATSPLLVTPTIKDSSGGQKYVFAVSDLAADRTITLPLLAGNDTFVFNDFAATLTNKTISGSNNTVTNLTPSSSKAVNAVSALAIDWTLSNVHTKTLGAGGNTFTFTNQASGMVIVVRLTSNGGGSTVTWPTVKWAGGVAPTQTSTGTDVYTFVHDGTSIYGSVVQDMS